MTKRIGLAGIFMVALMSLAGVAYAKIVSGTNGADNLTGTAEADQMSGYNNTDTLRGKAGKTTNSTAAGEPIPSTAARVTTPSAAAPETTICTPLTGKTTTSIVDLASGPGDDRVFYDHDGDFANVDNCEQIIPGG